MRKKFKKLEDLPDEEFDFFSREAYEKAKSLPSYSSDPSFRNLVDKIGKKTEEFSDACAKETSEFLLRQAELHKAFTDLGSTYEAARIFIIERLKSNPYNDEFIKDAKEAIEIEKECGMYNAIIWHEVLKFL